MNRLFRPLRAAALVLGLLLGASTARAAEAGWPAAFSKALPRTAGASNLVKLGRQDRAEFDRVAALLGKALQRRDPRITPASIEASPDGREIAEFISAENEWARKIAENPHLESSPAGRIAAAARARTLVDDLYPILEGPRFSALQSALPALKENSRKAYTSAQALAEQLVAESREENAPAPLPAPPAPPAPPRPENGHLKEMRLAVNRAVDMMLGHNFLRGHNAELYAKARSLKEVVLPLQSEPAEEGAYLALLAHSADAVFKEYEEWLVADKIMMPQERQRLKAEAAAARLRISQINAGVSAAAAQAPASVLGRGELERARESLRSVITFVGGRGLSDPWLNEMLISAKGLWTASAQAAPGSEAQAIEALIQKGEQILGYYQKLASKPTQGEPLRTPQTPAEPPRPLPPASYSLRPAGLTPAASADELGRRVIAFVQKEEALSFEQRAKLDVWIKAMEETWRTAAAITSPELRAQFQKGILMRSRFLLDDYRYALKALDLTYVQKAARRRLADLLAEEVVSLERISQHGQDPR